MSSLGRIERTMIHRLQLRRWRIGIDREPGIAGGMLVFDPHRFVPFKTTPFRGIGRASEQDYVPLVDKLLKLGLMMGRNLPEPVTPFNRDSEPDAHHRPESDAEMIERRTFNRDSEPDAHHRHRDHPRG
jgi:hypothetical protein